jgi:uncharacterized protein
MPEDAVTPESLARELGLSPHPEGGYYKEVYRCADEIAPLPARFGAGRNGLPYSTSIYYLAASPDFSAFHRIRSDELWYFHAGTGMRVHCLDSRGGYRAIELGPRGPYFGAVAAGAWFAAEPYARESAGAERAWALVGCAVSPGFDFRDFELADRAALGREHPDHASLIERLTRA